MTSNTDQNLLFGIIALQMGFVRRDQLVAATSTWLTDKSRQLAEILVEQGALSDADHKLLAPLVARHIENHGGDPQRSLAALSSVEEVADELRSLGDDGIEATLSIVGSDLTKLYKEAFVPSSVASSTTNSLPRDATDRRFRVLRSHARGGLGEVFVAKDIELNREVALKEIQTKYADDENSRLRFLLEAEVTGGLEHPGIVPVYGLGRYEDGRPFYAMRFIKGDSLQGAVDRFHGNPKTDTKKGENEDASNQNFNGLEFRKLLGRFIDVCQAIEYAHSRGVLHRDLKPGNIMLGKYGETLVVDWGLAKAQGRDEEGKTESETTLRPRSASGSAATMMGSAIGTPAFMPPEQAAGDLERLGPASDVYSLGATLYYLLTGRPPFQGKDLTKLLANVKSGNFPSPNRIQANAPRALTAICLKAMTVRPQDRYASPQSLAEDVERFLADETVSVFREPVWQRARRWGRKHPAVFASTAAVISLSVIGLGVFSTMLKGKNAELAKLVASLRESNVRETTARNLAEANEQAAVAQSQLAYSTLYSVVGDLQLELRNVPGAAKVRRRILQTSLPKLDEIATEFVSAENVDAETAWVLINLGDLSLELILDDESKADTSPTAGTESNGPTAPIDLAAKFYQRALAISQRLVRENPDNVNARSKIALAYDRIASIASRRGDTNEALAAYEKSLDHAQKIATDHPSSDDGQLTLARALMLLGDFYVSVYRKAPEDPNYRGNAEAYARKSVDINETLVKKLPDNQDAQQDLALAYLRMGSVISIAGESAAALPWFEQAEEVLSQLLALDATNVRMRRNWGATLDRILIAQRRLGRLEDACDTAQKICAIAEELAKDNAGNLRDQENLGSAYHNLALVHSTLKQWDQALVASQKSIDIYSRLVETLPNDRVAQSALASVYRRYSWIQSNRNNWREALASRQRAIAIQTTLAQESPDDIAINSALAYDLQIAAEINLKHGQSNAAMAALDSGIKAMDAFLERAPDNAKVLKLQTMLRFQLGQAYQSSHQYDAASDEYELAITLGQKVLDAGLDDSQTRINVTMAEHYAAETQYIGDIVLGEWSQLLEQSQDELPAMLNFRANVFIHRRQYAAAVEAASKVRDLETVDPVELYNSACLLCRCAASIDVVDEDAAINASQKEAWIADAIASLKAAIAAGFDDLETMQNDEDLAEIREHPEFKALISK
ncbi:protein kinase domain-containing protein [Planctomycetaceae bacterium SH139]